MSKNGHWSESQEIVSTSRPLKLTFMMVKYLPAVLLHAIVLPVSFFYFLFAKTARKHVLDFQKQMRSYTGGKEPKILNSYLTISSFALSIVEKMEGWLGKIKYRNIIRHEDSMPELIDLLNHGKGALLIVSHLGNIELMRSLSSFCETGVSKRISVSAIMSMKVTSRFNNTLKEINPDAALNIIDSDSITPETICTLQDEIENGGLVVITGDRTSAHSRNRFIKQDFLGRTAEFPYGVFLIAELLKAPVFFVFSPRSKNFSLLPKSCMFVEKPAADFASEAGSKARISALCSEYVRSLEKYCIKYPYQWYNFYDFWQNSED